ncbi:hypothetical protein ES703_56544 [subsurface metagenome]
MQFRSLCQLVGKPASTAVEDKAVSFLAAAFCEDSLGCIAVSFGKGIVGVWVGLEVRFDLFNSGSFSSAEAVDRAFISTDDEATTGRGQSDRSTVYAVLPDLPTGFGINTDDCPFAARKHDIPGNNQRTKTFA